MYIFIDGWGRSGNIRGIGTVNLSEAKDYERRVGFDDTYVYLTEHREYGWPGVESDGVEISWGSELYCNGKYQIKAQLSKKDIAFLFIKAFGNDHLDAVLRALERARSPAT